jgi:hypothetical protein
MFTHNRVTSNAMSRWVRRVPWLVIPVMLLSFSIAYAQQLTGTLSGIVTDQTEARVPGAQIVVKNDASGDTRTSTADSSGFWSVTALIPGTYTVHVSATNFAPWEINGVVLNQGDSRTVPNIRLKIGGAQTAVTVISGQDAEIPVDNAEVSATLNNELVDTATLTGRNAAELIKMMPGVTFNNGGGVGGYSSTTTGTNNGPAGSFSANGTQPYGSTDVYLDGANLIDPGNAGTQVANINQDMTDSVKYLSASYGAEYAKGPAVLQAFSKSGGQKFHGEGYIYARDSSAGFTNDWNNNAQGNPIYPAYFYYVGGNIGGPVFFPHFNHNRDKLFFWGGYENMIQHPYNAPVNLNVPTADQRAGDFNNHGIPAEVYHWDPVNGQSGAYQWGYSIPCNSGVTWQGCDSTNSPWMASGGFNRADPNMVVPNLTQYFDPDGVKVTNINPTANETPTKNNGWSNYVFSPSTPTNRWEATGKVTYAFSDNTKIWGSYAYQSETDNHPLSIWWQPANSIPYPGAPSGKETANVYLANLTHAFSATTTNEFVFAYSKFVNANKLSDPAAVSRTTLGVATTGIFGDAHKMDQMPDFFDAWANGTTDIRQFNFGGGIYGPNSFGKTSKAPSFADTFTKIVKSHSVKAGFYWDTQENLQSYGGWDGNGEFNVSPWGNNSTSNLVLDRLLGRQNNYNESISQPVPDELWHQWSLWAQDSWKATRKLTLNIGLRADHMGQWYDTLKGGGTQVWDASSYVNTPNPPANTGLLWHQINPAVPISGWSSKLFTYNPRLGVAYDVFGTGRTVIRAGFGTYRYQVSDNDAGNAMNGPLGSFNFNTGGQISSGFYGYNVANGLVYTDQAHTQTKQLAVPAALNQVGGSINADKWHDDKVPYADTYSFGIAQALPSHTVMEISYVGSASRNQLLNGTSKLYDANPVPIGALFGTVTNPYSANFGKYENPGAPPAGQPNHDDPSFQAQDFRPLHNYQTIGIFQHGGYANYNSLQISGQKQSGNLYLFSNFTFGKVLGTRDGSTSNGNGNGNLVDPFVLANNYGPLGYDHTKVFNLSFTYKLPKPIHGNWALGQLINGWELSNYTTYQDGSPYQTTQRNMQAVYNGNFLDTNHPENPHQDYITMPNGHQTTAISTSSWFGTDEYPGLMPLLTCDPRKHLMKNQYFNPNCFAAPLPPTATSYGVQGQWIWPYIRTPHYFGSDLAIFKAFRVNDSQRFEVRVSATNWLNHPNAGFGVNGGSDNQLIFNGYSTAQALVYNHNQSTTGIPAAKQGYRWMQFAGKYYF